MLPSEVRERVLDDHRVLRGHLERVRAVAEEGPLREALGELIAALHANIALEIAILAPELRDTDAFGDVRGRQLVAHHETQVRSVAECLVRLAEPGIGRRVAVDFVLGKMQELAADIDEEESTLLDSTVLRDDTVTISPTA